MPINSSLIPDIISHLIWLPLLYAETHYRFKYFFSRLNKAEPEIIADCPSRIRKGELLPVLVIIKDADRYPVNLIEVDVYHESILLGRHKLDRSIQNKYKEIILPVPSQDIPTGICYLQVKITYQFNEKIRVCWNDNHRGTTHAPFPVYISGDTFPRLDGCLYGEPHAHTIYTSDQVEFGASLGASVRLGQAMELDFFCATDHSYDMDDLPDNYLQNDPDLQKWKQFWQETEEHNKNNDFQIIPGEEVTVRNSYNRNVHCLVYNSRTFFHGTGDSAEKWFRTRSELSIPELLNRLSTDEMAFAAHPGEKPPFLQWLLIKRGYWQQQDCEDDRLHGLQFINNSGSTVDNQGKQLWIALLLRGFRRIGLAGNDAHGNFARFRQIGIPFLSMRENYLHLFGQWRTGVYMETEKRTMAGILNAIRRGTCFMTNGPALSLMAKDDQGWQQSGKQLKNITRIKLQARSSPEFSALKSVKIFIGFTGSKHESNLYQDDLDQQHYEYQKEIDFLPEKRNGYFRAEIVTQSGRMALSNPVWF